MIVTALTLCVLGLVALYAFFNPGETLWMPKCIFHSLTGLQCPGCGSQRAIHALLTGHPIEAIKFNFSWVLAVPVMTACAAVELFPARLASVRRVVYSRNFCLTILVLIIIWTVVRNVIGC